MELFVRAAELAGQTLSEFMRIAAKERAESIIARYERIELSAQARERFFNTLENPPEPNRRLIDAASRYARDVIRRP